MHWLKEWIIKFTLKFSGTVHQSKSPFLQILNWIFSCFYYKVVVLKYCNQKTIHSKRTKRPHLLKPRPNDHNKSTQHTCILLGSTCCVRLATVLRCVAACWVFLAQVWNWSNIWVNNTQHIRYAFSLRIYHTLYVIDVINVYYYMTLSHKDWELPDLGIWLAEMDIDCGLDFPI